MLKIYFKNILLNARLKKTICNYLNNNLNYFRKVKMMNTKLNVENISKGFHPTQLHPITPFKFKETIFEEFN